MDKAMSSETFFNEVQRRWLCRLVFAWIAGTLVYAWFSHTLPHQLQAPALRYPYVDLSYWLLHALQIPEFITGHYAIALGFDCLLVALAIGSICFPQRRWLIAGFVVGYFIYFILFNSYGGHHTNPKIGCLLLPLPFLLRNDKSFGFGWEAMRYFVLFAMSSAFAWKLLRGSWWQPDQGMLIMQKNLVAYLYFNPDTWLAGLSRWFLQHPALVNGLFVLGVLLEGIFLLGFFTRKYDHWLLLTGILLLLGFWFMAHAVFFEMLLLFLPLVRFHRFHFFQQLGQRLPEVAAAR